MQPRLFQVTDQIFLTLWVGGMWVVGYVDAPTLFNMLDRHVAGTVAGKLFTIMSIVGLVCGSMLALSIIMRTTAWLKHKRLWVIAIMLLITIIGEFILQPMMAELKKTGLIEGSVEAVRFARLHGISASLFLVQSILGLGLVVFRDDDYSSRG